MQNPLEEKALRILAGTAVFWSFFIASVIGVQSISHIQAYVNEPILQAEAMERQTAAFIDARRERRKMAEQQVLGAATHSMYLAQSAPLTLPPQETSVSTPECPRPSMALQRGAQNMPDEVRALQQFLAKRYQQKTSDLVTGHFGPLTERLLLRFQQEQGLPPVGIVGPLTRAAIARGCTTASSTSTEKYPIAAEKQETIAAMRGAELVHTRTNEFLELTTTYLEASESGKKKAMTALERGLERRKEALLTAMREAPEAAFANLLPDDLLDRLPPEIAAKIEEWVTVNGTLETFHEDDIEHGVSRYEYILHGTGGNARTLHAVKGDLARFTGREVTVSGMALDKQLLLAEAGGTSIVLTGTPPTTLYSDYALGTKKILYIPTHSSEFVPLLTTAELRAITFTNATSVAAHYKENSFKKLTMAGDVYPSWIQFQMTTDDCKLGDPERRDEFKAVTEAQGYLWSNYDIVMFITPDGQCDPGSAGWSSLPSPYLDRVISQADLSPDIGLFRQIVEHELGHAIGSMHANFYDCDTEAMASQENCTEHEYGELWDPLGGLNPYVTSPHSNAPHKVGYRWLTGTNILDITTNGAYTVAPLELATSAVQVLRIPKYNTNEYYYISYRQPIGMDADLPSGIVSGASVHFWSDSTFIGTRLIDTRPTTEDTVTYTFDNQILTGGIDIANAALADGLGFTDTANGITVTQVSHNPARVMLNITVPQNPDGWCTARTPTTTLRPESQTATVVGQPLTYTFSIQNNDSGSCAPRRFPLYPSVPEGFRGTFPTDALYIAPGATGNALLTTQAPLKQANGSYSFVVNTDGNGAFGTHIVFVTSTTTSSTLPDLMPLAPATISMSGCGCGAGASFTLRSTTTNSGTKPAGSFANKFEVDLNRDGTIDTVVTADTVTSLAAGASRAITGNWTPSKVGLHRIRAVVDTTNAVSESNEGNNTSPWTDITMVTDGIPNLTSVHLRISDYATNPTAIYALATPIVFEANPRNAGTGNSGQNGATFHDKFEYRLEGSTAWATFSEFKRTLNFVGIGPLETTTGIKFPTPGKYQIRHSVDARNAIINETSEADNYSAIRTITITNN